VAQEVKAEARQAAPEAVNKAAAALAPKLDQIVDEFVQRLQEFIAERARPWRADRRGAGTRAGRAPQSR